MSITFPRDLPSTRILGVYFEPEPQQAGSPEISGRYVAASLGGAVALWEFKLNTTPPTPREFAKWRAWLDSLNGSVNEFYGRDPNGAYPMLYPPARFSELTRASSGGAFDGTTEAWELNDARTEITMGGDTGQELPAGFQLVECDYVGFRWTTEGEQRRSLHRVLDDATANGSGVGTWTLYPHVDPNVPDTAEINLVRADCIMVVLKRERDREHTDRRISFEAKQNLEF